MVPAQLVPARIAMFANPRPQAFHFGNELLLRELGEILVHGAATACLRSCRKQA